MSKAHRHFGNDIDTHTQRIRAALMEPKPPADDPTNRPENRLTGHQGGGRDVPPGAIWHNLLYGIGAAGVTVAPLFIPGIGYFELMVGVTALALGIFLLVLLAGVFREFLPLGRQAKNARRRKR